MTNYKKLLNQGISKEENIIMSILRPSPTTYRRGVEKPYTSDRATVAGYKRQSRGTCKGLL
jgi:hypothetical protein